MSDGWLYLSEHPLKLSFALGQYLYAILNKVFEGLAKQRANGNELPGNGKVFLRHINKLSGEANKSTMLERSIRASLSRNLTEGDDHIYADEVAKMSKYIGQVAGMERQDDDADYNDIADKARAYAAILVNRLHIPCASISRVGSVSTSTSTSTSARVGTSTSVCTSTR